jgi:hypothetical protein
MNNMRNHTANNAVPANFYRRTDLNPVEYLSVYYYTGIGFGPLNRFLYSESGPQLPPKSQELDIMDALKTRFPKSEGESDRAYRDMIWYYYFVNLYNAIVKAPHLLKPFRIYRGTHTWYLKNNRDRFYYMNSFVSTSLSKHVAERFSTGQNDRISPRIYIFYVHPQCSYLSVRPMSQYKKEDELVLTPYHRYIFISETPTTQTYVVLPCDIDIPNTLETFLSWKNTIQNVSAPAPDTSASGGRIHSTTHTTRIENKKEQPKKVVKGHVVFNQPQAMNTLKKKHNVKRTIKYNPSKTHHKRETMKKLKSNRRHTKKTTLHATMTPAKVATASAPQNVKETMKRMTEPIPSFAGKPPTKSEKEVIEKMVAFFKGR